MNFCCRHQCPALPARRASTASTQCRFEKLQAKPGFLLFILLCFVASCPLSADHQKYLPYVYALSPLFALVGARHVVPSCLSISSSPALSASPAVCAAPALKYI